MRETTETPRDITVWGIGTPRTLRVHWALHELGVAYATEPVRTRTAAMERADFLAVSPGRKIPALQHGDLALTESGAITRYLMRTFAPAPASARERAEIDRWTFFILTEIDATALYVLRRHEGLPEVYGEAPAAVAAAVGYAECQFAVIEDVLRDGRAFLVGERLSEADIHLGSCLDWARFTTVAVPPLCAAFRQRMHERAAYRAAAHANHTAPR